MNDIIHGLSLAIAIYTAAWVAGRGFAAGFRKRVPFQPLFVFYPFNRSYGFSVHAGDISIKYSSTKSMILRICGWWTVIFNYGRVQE